MPKSTSLLKWEARQKAKVAKYKAKWEATGKIAVEGLRTLQVLINEPETKAALIGEILRLVSRDQYLTNFEKRNTFKELNGVIASYNRLRMLGGASKIISFKGSDIVDMMRSVTK